MTEIALRIIASIQVGYQAKARIKEKARGTHRLIQSKDFDSSHRLRSENLTAFFPERKPEIYSVRKGDILFQARGAVHFAYCIEDDLKDTLAAGSFYILRTKNKDLLPQYLAWWLNQAKAQAWFQSQARGAGMSFISKSTLSRLQVRISPISVQEKVVKIVTLARHEQFLLNRLASTRSRLVKAVCIKAIQEQER
ncbi:MAG: restriction endonuclease subunit S [Deltaproteobacteria bacterium]|nr:restriction endonuclease subunit S [Deltaproteobacteria bacterium]